MTRKSRLALLLTTLSIIVLATWGHHYYVSTQNGNVIFEEGSTYFTPGKDNYCTWVIFIESEVRTAAGSFSTAYIGIPEYQKRGAITAIIEVVENTVLFSFNMPGGINKAAPIVLTSSSRNSQSPAKKIVFKWFSSTGLTFPLYSTRGRCLAASKPDQEVEGAADKLEEEVADVDEKI
jgi:hypothetical protein